MNIIEQRKILRNGEKEQKVLEDQFNYFIYYKNVILYIDGITVNIISIL